MIDYDKVAERNPLIPREELEALGRVWEDPVTRAALRKFLNSFRLPAVETCTRVVPEGNGYVDVRGVYQAPGQLKVTFAQGKITVLDDVWSSLETLYKEEEPDEQKTV